jgi:hypothetical protein
LAEIIHIVSTYGTDRIQFITFLVTDEWLS